MIFNFFYWFLWRSLLKTWTEATRGGGQQSTVLQKTGRQCPNPSAGPLGPKRSDSEKEKFYLQACTRPGIVRCKGLKGSSGPFALTGQGGGSKETRRSLGSKRPKLQRCDSVKPTCWSFCSSASLNLVFLYKVRLKRSLWSFQFVNQN